MNLLLEQITQLSHEFGTADYVRGGGGNTSCKTADTLWVKPSGTTLSGMRPETFVAMDRAALGRLYTLQAPADPAARETLVKDAMAAAVKPGSNARPSVEAPLHDALGGAFVVHTHPALVNGLTCAQQGAAACARLFPEALWIPYIDPGFTLCMDVRRRIQAYETRHGRAPRVLILQNHGIFVTGDTPEDIRAAYRNVMDKLRAEYARAGVALTLPTITSAPAAAAGEMRRTLADILGSAAAGIAGPVPWTAAPGPISPDHIVYAKSFPCEGAPTRESVEAFRRQHGYTPLVFNTPAGLFAIGSTRKKADLALELALDGALVRQLAAAFGGILYMTDRAREFIEHWEVESYRQKQMG